MFGKTCHLHNLDDQVKKEPNVHECQTITSLFRYINTFYDNDHSSTNRQFNATGTHPREECLIECRHITSQHISKKQIGVNVILIISRCESRWGTTRSLWLRADTQATSTSFFRTRPNDCLDWVTLCRPERLTKQLII